MVMAQYATLKNGQHKLGTGSELHILIQRRAAFQPQPEGNGRGATPRCRAPAATRGARIG